MCGRKQGAVTASTRFPELKAGNVAVPRGTLVVNTGAQRRLVSVTTSVVKRSFNNPRAIKGYWRYALISKE